MLTKHINHYPFILITVLNYSYFNVYLVSNMSEAKVLKLKEYFTNVISHESNDAVEKQESRSKYMTLGNYASASQY